MRFVTLAIGAAAVMVLAVGSANADPIQQGKPPTFVNDRDGGVIPRQEQDPEFVLNPDGDQAANYAGDSDQDEGGDIAIYQGNEDTLPA